MYSFIVLGIVPGTNLQITFLAWLDLLGMAVAAYALLRLKGLHHSLAVARSLRRRLLHASQLHQRA